MKEFKDKVAVITGAASGIGRGIAERCAQEGMKIVLADIEKEALTKTEEEMKATGATVLAVPTDVSKARDVEALAQKTLETFEAVHLLCNNAGVDPLTSILDSTLADWEWVIGVNLWGVIHGIRTFVPIMLKQDNECHIVNTSSVSGLISYPGGGVYKVTKHGVVTLSETLFHELTQQGAKIRVSVLCPGFVRTRIMESERNRPSALRNPPIERTPTPEELDFIQRLQEGVQTGTPSEQVADQVLKAIQQNTFYILTHPEFKEWIQLRMENILQERNPTLPKMFQQ